MNIRDWIICFIERNTEGIQLIVTGYTDMLDVFLKKVMNIFVSGSAPLVGFLIWKKKS